MDPASTTSSGSSRAPAAGYSRSPDAAAACGPPPEFPAGLRVLLVDDDVTCLKIIGMMLRKCLYDVTTCSRAAEALSLLRERKGWFDLVLSDVYMPDMDGFKLLEHIGLEMDLPVIMMSADDHKDVVMKGVTHGAVDYLIKPVRMELLKNIWQHVVRKKRFGMKDSEQSGSTEESDRQKKALEEGDNVTSGSGPNWRTMKRKKEGKDDDEEEEDDTEEREDPSQTKKPRVVWSVELHQQFMTAVNQLGIDKAVPKKILELMKVPGLTRENVASHLQKYRLYLRRLSVPQNQARIDGPYTSAQEVPFRSGGVVGFDLQALSVSGQLLPALHFGARRATDTGIGTPTFNQMGFLSSGSSANVSSARSSPMYQMTNRGLSYLSGSPNNIESRQIDQPYHLAQQHGRNTPLKVEEETSVFFNMPPSQTRPLFPGANTNDQLNRSLLMAMSQPGQQFSLSQQHDNFLGQSISRGQVLNGIEAHDSRLASTVRQQMLPYEISSDVSERTVNTLNSSLPGNQISSLYGAVPQSLNSNIQNRCINESVASLYPHSSSIGPTPMTGSVQTSSKTSNLKGISDLPPSYVSSQNKSLDWKMKGVNLPYQSGQQFGSGLNNLDSGSSPATYQDRNTINACTVRKEILSVRTEIEHEKVECISQCNTAVLVENSFSMKSEVLPDTKLQDAFYDSNIISNELMNVVGKQLQEGTGEDASELFDGYSLDM
ncbi:hypothetical protein Cni_G19059 [Canna indica]|uniref:Two-component response regulator n=1 Tax=Canna indica TaxID=4628 RepID=A0AAQ3QGL4_9LILI|nr:hypothetical protein Cni_G19059 [Canna indica]